MNKSKFSALTPPDHVADLWYRWLQARGFSGTTAEQEKAYLESKGYDNWPDCLLSLGFRGHKHEQQLQFWQSFQSVYREPPTVLQRVVRMLAATKFGVWFIEKVVGMRNRIAA